MQRRMMIAALGAAFAAPAFAQTNTQPGGQLSPPAVTPGQAPPERMQRMMDRAEMQHMERTLKLGAASLATSRIALQKASNERVRMFAQFEVAEQETVADVLKSMKENEPQTTGSVDKPTDQEVRAELDDAGRRMVEQMEKAQRGAAFDRDYVQGQITGHRGLLDAQEDYLRTGRNREHVAAAKLARGHIREHIAHLEMIQAELGRRG
jgi:putative membrane protein